MAKPTLSRKKLALFQALARQQGLLGEEAFPIGLERHSGPAPLSFAQEGLWLLHQLNPEDPAYNEHFAVHITGRIDERALEQSVNRVVERHQVLRSTFAMVDGTPQASVADLFIPLVIEDVCRMPDADRLRIALEMAAAEASLSFDLAAGPLLRIKLIRLGDRESLLLLTVHHIAIDGRSLEIFLQEVAAAYEAYSTGAAPVLLDLPAQYSDFARWQREHRDEAREASELEYWTGQLAGAAPTTLVLQSPTAAPAISASKQTLAIEPVLQAGIEKVAQQLGVTVFRVWVAGLTALLSRYTGQDDIVTGTPVSVRPYRVLEELIGVFVNTLPLRVSVDANSTFRQLLARVHTTCTEAFAHQNVPLERIVQAVNPGFDRGGSPLFQTVVVFQEVPRLSFAGLNVTLIDVHNSGAKFDLSVSLRQAGDASELSFEYRKAMFEDAAIGSMGQHLLTLLSGALQDVEQRISDLPLLSQIERQQLLVEWNRTGLELAREHCVHHVLEQQAKRTPDAVAVECEGQQLSYEELNRRSNQLGSYLRTLGVGPDARIGICLERSLEMIVGILGILKAGGAYVPLDPDYPAERLSYMLEDARVEVVIAVRKTLAKLPANRVHVLLDADTARIAQESGESFESGASAGNLAYVIYTSGSTGRAKGVGITHSSVCNLWSALDRAVYSGQARVLKVGINAPFVFDASVKQWITLLGGHTLCIIPQSVRDNPDELVSYCEKYQIDVLDVTPSHLSLLMSRGLLSSTKLRLLLVGGEAIPASQWNELRANPQVQPFNVYGPTETTVDAVVCDIQSRPIPAIGKPIGNTQVYVMDGGGSAVPVGVAGELYIGGAGVARGYVNQGGMTAEKFIPDGMSGKEGGRLYRSGDRVRWRREGELEFLGRMDEQVKVRGYRVELGEIEAALVGHGGVEQAVAGVVGEGEGEGEGGEEKRLVAWVVMGEEKDGEKGEDLREYLRGRLPGYMVPGAIVKVKAMPVTVNGKVDRKALPEPDWREREGEEERSWRSAEEEIVGGIFAAVLKRERMGAEENFFEAGGHSLLATQVISRVRQVFGLELPLRAVFEAPTVARLAERVSAVRGEKGTSWEPAQPLKPRVREGDLRLSYAQQRLWFLQQMEPESAAYNIVFGVRLEGRLEKGLLRRSLQEMVRRHESLRTRFVVKEGEPVAEVVEELQGAMEEVDLRGLGEQERELEAKRRGWEEAERGFDLASGPLLRIKLLQLQEQEHVLLVNMHHIVSDGWSSGILMQEFSQLYGAYVQGEEPALRELEIQYGDYAVWQREWLQGEVLEEQIRYWRQQLGGLEALELPTDHARKGERSHGGGRKAFSIGKELSARLKEQARENGVTLFMSLLAGFAVVLGKYAGQEDVAVGTPVANRNRVEVEGVIGFFVNTLVLRTGLSGNPSFREVLKRVREVTLDAYQHQDMPFEKLVEELQPERDLSRQPLFQVMLVLQNTAPQELRMAGLRLSPYAIEMQAAKFDLELMLAEDKEGLAGELSYAHDLYEAGTVERLLDHLRIGLERMVAEPELRIGELSLLTGAEREQVLVEWNRTEAEYPQKSVPELFEEQVKKTPQAVAVACGQQSLTYAELDRHANQLGQYLKILGVGPEVRVGVCMDRTPEMIVALLGILKAGGAYVPLDANYPPERLAYMVADAQLKVVLSQQHVRKRLAEVAGEWVCLDEHRATIEKENNSSFASGAMPQNLAYVIYTSGSTGKPKGVGVAHRGLINLATWHQQTYQLTPTDRATQVASPAFDASVWETWPYLLSGSCIDLPNQEVLDQPSKLFEWLAAREITICFLPTPLAEIFGSTQPLPPVRLRALLTGGDKLHQGNWSSLPCPIINHYGPTENTVVSTCAQATSGNVPSIGKPIANARVYVLDKEFQPVPVGMAGELYVGGASLARGYVNRPDLTAERFVPDPFSNVVGERLYQTGDVVRFLADGNLEFLGRKDHQVKLRGFRIELGEIENALAGHPQVKHAVAMVRDEGAAEKRLVAYVVPQDPASPPDPNELRTYLEGKLPGYMVPGAIVKVKAMPVTVNGKVDRKALPEPDWREREGEEERSWRSAEEEIVGGIFAAVLKRERMGAEENFFEAGGHSLLATQVISRVRQVFGLELPLRAVFEAPTVARLAERVSAVRGEKGTSWEPAQPLKPRVREGDLRLSYAQQRLWFLQQMEPESAAYNIVFGVRLEGRLEKGLLRRSLQEMVRRHESLRTRFVVKEGEPVAEVVEELQGAMEEVDLRGLGEQERELEAKRRGWEEAERGFDLASGPLLRIKLLQLQEQEHVLLVNMHHIVSDGWSSGILMQEFSQLYGAYVQGEEPALRELEIQYGDYAVWQREWLQGEVLEEQIRYWRQQLGGLEALELPTDHARKGERSHGGGRKAFSIGKELSARLKEQARENGVTLFMSLLAGFAVVLGKYAGQEDVAVGTPVANRNRVEVEGVIGFFVNTLVLRTGLSGNPSFREVLKRVREVTLDAYQHQDMPFEKLVEELQPERDLSRQPLFQVMLVLQNTAPQELRMAGLRLSPYAIEMQAAKFDLELMLAEDKEGLAGELSYAHDLYEAGTVERLLDHLRIGLERMVAEPELRIGELSLLTGAEREQVLVEWNRTEAEYPQKSVPELFEEQVKKTPKLRAVASQGEALGYLELNRLANRLGRYLRKQGVRPDERVAICMRRGVEMVVGLLGIMKAGGAYVGLDSEYPSERLRYMIEDAGVRIVLTQQILAEKLRESGARLVCMDQEEQRARIAEESGRNPKHVTAMENLVYVIYTSGSTGKPKGVGIEHRQLANYVWGIRKDLEELGIGAGTKYATVSTLSADLGNTAIFPSLVSGGELHVMGEEQVMDGQALGEYFEREKIDFLKIVPSHLEGLRGVKGGEKVLPRKVLVVGGEASKWQWVKEWKTASQCAVINHYGPTETTVGAARFRVANEAMEEGIVPIGKPIGNTQVYVMDGGGSAVPVGVAGELYIGGAGVARGYVNQGGMTAEKFIPDGMSGKEGGRLYRSGDRVRWRREGELEFLGRMDEQVKVRGYRVELGEIEAALVGHGGVEQAVAGVVGEGEGEGGEEKRLVAWVVMGEEKDGEKGEDLREYLRGRLPGYMVPGAIVKVEAMPVTVNGKVDRKALPKPGREAERGEEYEAPQTAVQELVGEIWSAVLQVGRVSLRDNFFKLGGHSLLATQVVARLRTSLGIELPLRAMFETGTLAELAGEVARLRGGKAEAIPAIVRVERTESMPLSYAQQRLWFLNQLDGGSAAYNTGFGVRLSGELDRKAVEWSWRELVRRHEILRTSFPSQGGMPVQKIGGEPEMGWEEMDLREEGEEEREEGVRRLAREDGGRGFNLGEGPLLRIKLLRLQEQEHVLLVNMHHIVSDGWSSGILVQEFGRLYESRVKGEEAKLGEQAVQYVDYAVWQRGWLQGEVLERQVSYWKERLRDMEVLELPTDRVRPGLMSTRGSRMRVRVSEGITEGLKKQSRGEGVTLFMTLLASWQLLLGRYSGQEDIVVGTPIAGRTRTETNGVIGCFVNTVVLRTQVGGEQSWRELLGQVRERTLEAYEHQDVPFEKLVEELQPERDLSRQPLFQVMFGLQNLSLPSRVLLQGGEEGGKGVRVEGLKARPGEEVTAKFDLMHLVEEREEGIEGTVEYNTDLFEQETVATMIERWKWILEQVVGREGGEEIGGISLLRRAEREELVRGWRGEEVEVGLGREQHIGKLIGREAEREPEKLAVVGEGVELTYGELERRGNQWARRLMKEGVRTGSRVGVCVDGSKQGMDWVVVSLGVLKAGGVLVGLDAEEPGERLEKMVQGESGERVKVVVTTKGLKERFRRVRLLCVEELRGEVEGESGEEPEVEIGGESAACVLYRSNGGGPAGVVIKQRGLCGAVGGRGEEKKRERVGMGLNFRGEAGSLEIWRTLAEGGSLVNVPRGKLAPRKLAGLLRDTKVREWWAGGGELERIAREFGWGLRKVERVICEEGMEVLEELREKLPAEVRQRVYGVYGYSEGGGTAMRYSLATLGDDKAMVVEEVAPGVRMYLLDREREPAGEGTVGEIYIAGEWVGECYEGKREESGRFFVEDPYVEDGYRKQQMYRTGDWARRRRDGRLEWRGRGVGSKVDGRVIAGGERITAEEIEATLLEHEQVSGAAVGMRRGGEEKGRGLVALVVSGEGQTLVGEELRGFVQERVPAVMVPRSFIQVEEIKRDGEGRVNRGWLGRMLERGEGEESGGEYRGPRNEVEEQVAEVWARTLGLERVGIHENFFRLGGHSLLATQVVARLSAAVGVELALRRLFEAPTVAELARVIQEQIAAGRKKRIPRLVRVSREEALPLSFAQQRLWFIHQLQPESAAYNVPLAVRLEGDLDRAGLEWSLQEIVRRHETLRTTFVVIHGNPVQNITSESTLQIQEIVLQGEDLTARELEAKRRGWEEAERGFDLASGPLLRIKLLQLQEQEHVLLVNMHHIVSDGWSSGILMQEFSQLYGAYVQGEEPALRELEIQYGDYAVWQREWLQGEVLEEQIRYWRQQLGGLEALELPTDHARKGERSHGGGRKAFSIGKELSARLKEQARENGVTLFMSLLAGFAVVLGKYAGQEDVAVGTDIANRNIEETETLIGFFINQLVLRTKLSGNPSFREVLKRVQEVTLDAYQHQDVPFEKLVEELQPERDLSRQPLFQVKLVLQNAPVRESRVPGLRLSNFPIEADLTKFDFQLTLTERSEGLAGEGSYACDLYEAATVERLLDHLRIALERMVAEPELRIGELSLLTGAEREQVLVEWNRTEAEYPQKSVPELFEEQVKKTPQAVAVECEGQQLSYAELNNRSNQLGHYLRRLGVGPEVRVAIYCERGIEMIVGLLGILKSGGAYVPLDPAYPSERLAYMLEDAQISVVLTQRRMLDSLPIGWMQAVCIDEDWKHIEQESGLNSPSKVTRANVAYVIYTSGSTGRPKGVEVTHAGFANYLNWAVAAYNCAHGSGSIMHSSLSFDLTVTSIYPALLTGGCVKMLPESAGAEELAECLKWGNYSLLKLTPSHMQMLRGLLENRGNGSQGAHVLVIGGEALKYSELELWRKDGAAVRLINEYGPTETVVGCTIYEVGDEAATAEVPIGKPIGNTQVYVMDGGGSAVPVGVAGELYIGGAGVARGYVNQGGMTAEKFIPDGMSGKEGGRLYRSGDRVRWRREGELEFLGRMDEQVKVRGYRVELGEIEAALVGHGGVEQAVAGVVGEGEGEGGEEKRLVAWVVMGEEKDGEKGEDLREYLRGRLPGYMVPGAIVKVEAMPVTVNGKVDRKALPKPGREAERGEEYEAPQTAVQELVGEIWSAVLQVGRVSLRDNFFKLGGHSLLATQVVARLRTSLGIELPLRAMFETGTLAELAGEVARLRGGKAEAIPAIVRVERTESMPLSYAQQRLWFLNQLDGGSAAYNTGFGVRLSGELDRKAVEWSWRELVRRHEILRTSFPSQGGMPVQKIGGEPEMGWEEMDLREEGEEEREEGVRRLAREDGGRGFNLGEGPLLRIKLLRLQEQEHVLLVNMHHIVSDGWSSGILVQEFGRLYESRVKGEEAKLGEQAVQYVDYAVWQRGWLQGEVLERQVSYWKERLRDMEVLELPTDRVRPGLMSTRGSRMRVRVSEGITEGLKKQSRGEGVTLFMTLLASWQLLLGRYSGQEDIVVGTPIAGRTRTETNGVIGCFVNTVVLRTQVGGEQSWRELLGQVRERTLEAYEHQDVPFEKLVEELQPERDLSRQPLFQVMFGLQNLSLPSRVLLQGGEEGGKGVRVEGLKARPGEEVTAKFDLMHLVEEREEGIEGTVEYNTDLFEQETVATMIERWKWILEQVVGREGGEEIGGISLLRRAEREELVRGWRGEEVEVGLGREQHIGKLIGREAEREPEKLAVVGEGVELTYGELERRGNQWARRLMKEGVRTGSRVGVCVDGSKQGMDWVVVSLGVLKAGGVLVGLDAEEPGERLEKMVQGESGERVKVVVTTKGLKERFRRVRLLCVEELRGEVEGESGEEPEVEIGGESAACVLYRSNGGGPAGVVIKQRGLCGAVGGRGEEKKRERVGMGLNFRGEAGSLEIWRTLAEGGSLVNVPRGKLAPRKLAGLLRDTKVREWWAGGGELERIAREFGWGLRKVERVICEEGMEVLEELREKLPAEVRQRVYGVYGYSEGGGTAMRYSLATLGDDKAMVVEEVAPGVRMYLLDREREPAGEGTVGEIYIAGEWVGECYEGKREESGRFFVEDPYVEDGYRKQQMYRTGDWARRRRDGRLEWRGRGVGSKVDGRVIAGGERITAEEIEATLLEHEQVSGAAVGMRRGGEEKGRGLVALVVSGEGQTLVGEELRGFVQERVPAVMVPRSFIQVEEIKRDGEGRVNRGWLGRMLERGEGEESGGEYRGPRNEVEEQVAEVWARTLGLERVGIHENFFRLGGHSLLATQVVARLSAAVGVELALRRLFEAPTVAELARVIQEQIAAGRKKRIPRLVRVSREEALPLSFAQQRLWFIHQLQPESAAYNVPLAVRLEGDLNIEALQRSMHEIVRRHEVLRTQFMEVDGEPRIVIVPAYDWTVPIVDLSGPAWQELLTRERRAEASRLFDLSRAPLIRGTLLRRSDKEHVLLVTMHHIVSDGWSTWILVREFVALYEAYRKQQVSLLPEPEIQYVDYATWQRGWLQGEVLEEQIRYWRQQLEDIALLEMPPDYIRPAALSGRGASVAVRISPAAGNALAELSRREGATLFMTLLSAWQILLSRYSSQLDVAIGTDVANRNRVETENLIGFFVNQLVLRTRIEPREKFTSLLARVRAMTLSAYEHQDVPFEKLVEQLVLVRDLSRNPLFQVKMVLDRAIQQQLSVGELRTSMVESELEFTKLDLRLGLTEQLDGSVTGRLEFSKDLFGAETAQRIVQHWVRLLEAIAADPEGSAGHLPLLSPEERTQLLVDWNGRAEDYKSGIIDLISGQPPKAVAVVCGEQSLSYGKLDHRSNQLGHYLQRLGVGPEIRVALCAERGLETVIGMVGIFKAGGVYVPLEPKHPLDRLAYMLEETQAAVLLTQSHLRHHMPSSWAQVVSLDEDWSEIEKEPVHAPASEADAHNLAYVLFTSGSTGRPKGVAVERGALNNYVQAVTKGLDLPRASYALVSTMAADLGYTGVFGALCGGGTLHILAEDLVLDAEAMSEYFERHAIECCKAVPSLWKALLAGKRARGVIPRRRLILGGEALSWQLVEQIENFETDCEIYNHYGPTESTIGVLTAAITRSSGNRVGTAPLGRPIANTRVFVLDQEFEPVPPGVNGELYIGGAGLARGYLNNPEMTAEKFVPDAFSQIFGARLYRTGDLVKWRPDGHIEFVGRVDHQVKVRGYRIELGEIETVLQQHPDVERAAVLALEDIPGEKYLAAYVVRRGTQTSASVLRAYLSDQLPDYMVPMAFVFIPELPLTRNGKLDRNALPKPEKGDASIRSEGSGEPLTAEEEIVAGIWCDVLGIQKVGKHENFFELGGHSLLATQVISRVRNAFGVELPLRVIFESPTIAGMIEHLKQAQTPGQVQLGPTKRERKGDVPLSYSQQRLWFLDQLSGNGTSYLMSVVMRLRGELNVAVLEQSFGEVVRRHEMLRTRLPMREGEPVQVIEEAGLWRLPLVDLSRLEKSEAEAEARGIVGQQQEQPFDLGGGPLMRTLLVRLEKGDHLLVCHLHHLLADGWSFGLLTQEVSRLYKNYSEGKPSELPELLIQYSDYALWEREWLTGEILESRLKYWKQRLEGAQVQLRLPQRRLRPAVPSFRGERQGVRLGAEMAERVRAFSKREGTTLFMTMLSGFVALLHQYTGQEDLVVGSVIANRERGELEKLIGFLANTLVLRVDVSGEPSFRQLLGRVRETCLQAYAHQLPPEKLVTEQRVGERQPLYEVWFQMESRRRETLSLAGLEWTRLEQGRSNDQPMQTRFELSLVLREGDDGIVGNFEYDSELFSAKIIGQMIEDYVSIIGCMVGTPEARITEIELANQQETQELIGAFNASQSSMD